MTSTLPDGCVAHSVFPSIASLRPNTPALVVILLATTPVAGVHNVDDAAILVSDVQRAAIRRDRDVLEYAAEGPVPDRRVALEIDRGQDAAHRRDVEQ